MATKKDELSAYDALIQLQASTWKQADNIQAEMEKIDATIVGLGEQAEEALLMSRDPSGMEDEIQALKVKRANIAKRIEVLAAASGSDIFVDTAKRAIQENGEALKAVSSEWLAAVKKLDAAWAKYLEAVRLFKPLEARSSTLQSQREECHKCLPKGTPYLWAEGVPEPTRIDTATGPVFRCMDPAAIKAAYNNN